MIRNFNRWLVLAIIVIVAGGMALTLWTVQREDSLLRTDLLTETHLFERGITSEYVKGLTGSESDLGSSNYLTIKNQLIQIRSRTLETRFIYLMGQRPDGTVFFYVDSEPPG
jgi:hypothetical protein